MESVRQVDPRRLEPNKDNPRLIFREDEIETLRESIANQGILVPLTVYESDRRLILLDGERRWRCSLKLGLSRVPVIVQPEPTRLQNIMMMFAIHNARRDWDPLPTAMKLQELETEFEQREGRSPTEIEIANLASMTRGEVRRLRNLLALPEKYRQDLLAELEKPQPEQVIRADLILEATRGATALTRRGVIDEAQEEPLVDAIIDKFRTKVINSTVAPRQLARIARAVERSDVPVGTARAVAQRLISEPDYSIENAFRDSVEQSDFEHGIEQLAERLQESIEKHQIRRYEVSSGLREALQRLQIVLRQALGD